MIEGTRPRILQLLQKNGDGTVESLARAIGLATATVRRHLDILQRDGLVTFKEIHKKAGRPKYSFYLTEQGQETLPKGYDRLLSLMTQELALLTIEDTKTRNGEQILKLIFQRLSERASNEYSADVDGKDLEHRLGTLLHLLQQEDFSPEADILDGILRIRLLNCPYRFAALRNRAICSFDSSLISVILNVDPTLQECIQDGHSCCVYTANVSDMKARGFA